MTAQGKLDLKLGKQTATYHVDAQVLKQSLGLVVYKQNLAQVKIQIKNNMHTPEEIFKE